MGPQFCDSGNGTWEIFKEDGTKLFGRNDNITCVKDEKLLKPYQIKSCGGVCTSDPAINVRNLSGLASCGGVITAAYEIYGDFKVTWKLPGKYKIKYKPENFLCQVAERNITVVDPNASFSIGNLSGNPYPLCSFNGNITYSVPPIAGVTQYEWRFTPASGSLNMSFNGSTSITTAQASATATVTTSNGYASGTLTVIARTPCGTSSTRTFTVSRQPPVGGISGPSSICVGGYGSYAISYGATNPTWSITPASSFYISSYGYGADVYAYTSDYGEIRVTYNRECDNVLVTEVRSISANYCGYSTMTVAPNPVADEVEISYAEDLGEYEVKVYNAFNKVVSTGKLRKGKLRLDVHALPEGMYYVHLTDGKGGRVIEKLMKK